VRHSNPPFDTVICPYGEAAVKDAAQLIAAGSCVAVPTETVYGLAADATNGAAVAGIYAAKGRPSFNPLIVHVLDLAEAEKIAVFNEASRVLAERYWPGPLTLVLPVRARASIAAIVTAGLSTIALRVPAHPAMRALLNEVGKPLAAPSANASGAISPTRAAHVYKSLGGAIPMIIDDGPCSLGLESTIVAVDVDGNCRLLRRGPVDLKIAISASQSIEAPGQMESHYAPTKKLRLNVRDAETGCYHIGFGDIPGTATLSSSGNLIEAAANLFDLLHRADESEMLEISVAPIPFDGIGASINDRLARAATTA
jgi:L-threonylcarbamoyladenylate synthase